jgi:hypothetical protein
MIKRLTSIFLLALLILPLSNQAAETSKNAAQKITISSNKAGRIGATGADGKIIVPLEFDYIGEYLRMAMALPSVIASR